MVQSRRTFIQYLILLIVSVSCASAQSTTTLTQIQDTVYTTAGAPFNGTAVITWTGTTSTSGTGPFNTSVKISNGVLSVMLAPSTNITPTAYYQVVFNSSDGLTTWTETWAVPPSATPLTISQVLVSSSTGSGGSGGSGSSGNQVQISQVVGLSSDLNAIDSSLSTFNSMAQTLSALVGSLSSEVANLSNTVANLSSASTSANFIDDEIPGGTINGSNTVFTLANTPASSTDVTLFLNGVLLGNGTDYTVSGQTITFADEIPQTSDKLLAYYRISGVGPAANFVDDETPAGSVNGTNLSFALANAPSPSTSLKLFKNGALLQQNVDYTLSNQTITFSSVAVTPTAGDLLSAYYRTTGPTLSTSVSRGGFVPAQQGH